MILQYWHDITWKVLYLDAILYPTSELLRDRLTFVSKNFECNTEKVLQYLESIAILCNILSGAKLYHQNGE